MTAQGPRSWLRAGVVTALVAGLMLLIPGQVVAQQPTDQQIADAVEDEILFDQAVRLAEIEVEVVDNVVTLSGTVDNLLAKRRAERIARAVKGVEAVVDNLAVVASVARSDAEIRRDAAAALTEDPATESYEISVVVDDGTAILEGNVDSWQEKKLAEYVVAGVRGVTAVDNRIDIALPDPQRPDTEIAAEVREMLRANVLVDDGLIDVSVEDGLVRLEGTVGSASEKAEAKVTAWVAGVHDVDATGLEVARWARDEDLRDRKYAHQADSEIAAAVKDAMLYDPRVNSFDITAQVSDGIVTLRGTVDNVKAKRAAEEDARNTVGVVRVENRIRIEAPVEVTDEEAERRLQDALLRDPYVERFEIDANVVNGIVTLDGQVESNYERSRAGDIAARTSGVTEVVNNLEVTDEEELLVYDPYVDPYLYDYDGFWTAPRYTFTSDATIEEEIADELWWSPFVDSDDVDVTVDDGVATLTGTVDSWSERAAATENAFEGGAAWVDNDLVVADES